MSQIINPNNLVTHSPYLWTGDLRLLDHDQSRGDQSTLSDVIHRVISHGLQEIDCFLLKEIINGSILKMIMEKQQHILTKHAEWLNLNHKFIRLPST